MKTLESWVSAGWAVKDAGDGAWCWSEKGKEEIDPVVRQDLSYLLYQDVRPLSEIHRKLVELSLKGDLRFSSETGEVIEDA